MQSSTSPQQLTPRSKIKAVLAAVDDESGSEANLEWPKEQHLKHGVESVQENLASVAALGSGNEDDSNSDSRGAPIVPRGRLAACLHDQQPSNDVPSDTVATTDEETEGNAYERIRKRLLSKKGDERAKQPPALPSQRSTDDDDAGIIIARRRKKLQAKSQSPITSLAVTPTRSRKPSPGLFFTPRPSASVSPKEPEKNNDSDSDLPADPQRNERFLALVARKRAERETKQAAENRKRAAREARMKEQSQEGSGRVESSLGDSEDESDDNTSARKLTQQARPTRKASKKALEEMNREMQRMNRNMQLAHHAKTKKKITKESLFARFNFPAAAFPNTEPQQALSSSTITSSIPASDTEMGQSHETPPSSPLDPTDSPEKPAEAEIRVDRMYTSAVLGQQDEFEYELPSIQDVMSQPRPSSLKGKGKADEPRPTEHEVPRGNSEPKARQRSFKVRLLTSVVRPKQQIIDSDSDLEIVPARKSKGFKLNVFNRVPAGKASEVRSLQTLRALAYLNSPERQSGKSKPSMTLSDMQLSLQQRARQQAAAERAEKVQDLKNRGVIVQTAEERQRDQAEVEDLVEQARREAEAISKKERGAAKKEKRVTGEDDALGDTSDEDEDYEDSESEVELSGSDEERAVVGDQRSGSDVTEDEAADSAEEEGGVDLLEDQVGHNGFVVDEASEDAEIESCADKEEIGDADEADDDEIRLPRIHRRPRANRVIDSDDEDAESQTKPTQNLSPTLHESSKPMIPGLAMPGYPALPMMCMTQAFAATMADTQTQAHDSMDVDQEQASLAFLGPVPEPNFPIFDPLDTESMILDSQDAGNTGGQNTAPDTDINLRFSQSQIQHDTAQESQELPIATQEDDIPDPTQDVGFGMSSPAANRFVTAPPSTIDTVLLPGVNSPMRKKKGRLQRGKKAAADLSDSDEAMTNPAHDPGAFGDSVNAFDVMKKKRNAPLATRTFDKKKSEAKDLVEDQALESEDEYAGLGGASDDETGGSDDEEVRKMIEHGEVNVDEGKLAAFYA